MANMYKLIMKGDRGKLFKGHSFSLTTSNKEICLVNSYFAGTVIDQYDYDKNATSHNYSITAGYTYPKWLKAIKERLVILGLPLILQIKYKGTKLICDTTSYIYLSYKVSDEGISFTNHRENITKLMEMTELYRHCRLIIKSLTDDDFMSFTINSTDNGEDIIQLPKSILCK